MATQRLNETFGDPSSAEAVRKAVDALARRSTIGVGDTLVDFEKVPPALLVQALAGLCYAMRDDDPTVYIISRFLEEKVSPTAATFAQAPAAEAPPPDGAPGGPGGMGGMDGIPPDLMRQIQAQLQAQGGGQ